MSVTKIHCERPDCPNTLKVDPEQDATRCPKCGHKHRAPWTPAAETDGGAVASQTPQPPAETEPAGTGETSGDASRGVRMDAEDGLSIQLDVHVHVHHHE